MNNMRDPNEFGIPWGMILILGGFLLIMVLGLANLSEQDLGNPQPMALVTQLHHLEIDRQYKGLYHSIGR